MKKIIFIPLLLVMGIVNAQLQFGLKGGVNISNFTGGDFPNFEKNLKLKPALQSTVDQRYVF